MLPLGGTYRYTLDAKGRINIPAPLRKLMTGDSKDWVYIAKGFKSCSLFIYPAENWFAKMKELSAVKQTEADASNIRAFAANSQPEELDGQGRIVIPPEYLRDAGLAREVLIIGVNDRIEVWNPEAYERRQAETEQNYQQMIKLF